MDANTKANTKTTKSTGLEHSTGQMEEYIKENGQTGSNTEKASTKAKKAPSDRASGKTESELNG